METTRTNRALTEQVTTAHDFGVTDRLNRKMGLKVRTFVETFTVSEDGRGWAVPAGVYYSYNTQTTRNGENKQASHDGPRFATAEERDAAVAKAVKATKKRAEDPKARTKA